MTVERLAAALSALSVPEDAVLSLAVSGGPDSLALLLLAAEARPGRVHVITVDHGLRTEAEAEAARVADQCRALSVPHTSIAVSVVGSVQAAARAARYEALGDWCAGHGVSWLATAHHADDQAETLLMRLSRGAGLAGLAGIRASRTLRSGVRLIRPLLDWRKHELVSIVSAAGLEPAVDPSNADPAYDRTHARTLLSTASWLEPKRIADSARHLAQAEAALAWTVDRVAQERMSGDSINPIDLPPEILRRLMLGMFARFGEAPRGPELSRLIATLQSGRPGTLGALKVTPGQRWTFASAPPRRADQ